MTTISFCDFCRKRQPLDLLAVGLHCAICQHCLDLCVDYLADLQRMQTEREIDEIGFGELER